MFPKTRRYQFGCIQLLKTAQGPCWYLRFSRPDGTRPRIRVGLKSRYPTKAAVERAVSHLRDEFNKVPHLVPTRTFGDVIARYEREEMPRQYSTASTYAGMLRKHIEPRWGDTQIEDVRAFEVREWLANLKSNDGRPLSTRTCGHIRDLMRVLFRFAMLWEWMPVGVNPMTLFRLKGSTTREEKPRFLTPAESDAVLTRLPDPVRTMAIIAGCLGLRMSEISGLKWKDFDWIKGLVTIERAVVHGREAATKTEASRRALPLHDGLAEALHAHRRSSKRANPEDYVFASPAHTERPYALNMLQKRVLRPAFEAAGIVGPHLGWHTFRHTYRSWLGSKGVNLEDQRDLMRHSDIATTMNVYGSTFPESLREANAKVVEMILGGVKKGEG